MDVGRILPLLVILTLETIEGIRNVSRHGEMHTSLEIVPVEGESEIALAFSVFSDIIMLFNYTNQMIYVLLSKIFHSKIVDN